MMQLQDLPGVLRAVEFAACPRGVHKQYIALGAMLLCRLTNKWSTRPIRQIQKDWLANMQAALSTPAFITARPSDATTFFYSA